MTASETVDALEAHLITQAEAIEQAMCDRIDEVYEKAASEYGDRGEGTHRYESRRHA